MVSKWKILPSLSTGKESAEQGVMTDADVAEPPQLRRPTTFTSRIARAFSRPNEPRGFVKQTGPLFSLPFELLERIYDSIQSKDLCNLRRTCSQLNEHLEPRVFEKLTIDSAERGSHTTGQLLKALSSGKAPCSYLTTTLHISNMLIFSSPTQSNWQDPNIDHRLQPLQERYISPAFKALRNLKRIYWSVRIKDPYLLMADGLAGSTLLEELHLTFDHWVESSVFPIDRFSNLTVLALEEGDFRAPLASDTVVCLKKALQFSPNLVNFRIGVEIDQVLTLDDILCPPVKARLSHIRALDHYWHSFKLSWPVLSNLTSVDIPNVSQDSTRGLWKMLQFKQVLLLSITVEAISPALVKYLSNYSGLETLHVKKAVDLEDDLGSEFYVTALQRHRLSFSVFSLKLSHQRQAPISQWVLKREYLESILQCPMLKELTFPLRYWQTPNEPVGIELNELLRALAHLPHLRRLHLVPIFKHPLHTHHVLMWSANTLAAIRNEVRDIEVSELNTFRFSVQLLPWCFVVVRRDGEDGRPRYAFEDINRPMGHRWIDGVYC